MDWISDWIRQIILIIFIATFIDLLLPSSSLDRYVKLVMGLIIIMAILQPVLQLVISDNRWSQFSSIFSSSMSTKTYATLDEIGANSQQIAQVQQDEIKKHFQSSIQNWVAQQVSKKFHVKVVSAKVIAEFQKKMPTIKQIRVVAVDAAGNVSSQTIEPIQPVEIQQHAPTSAFIARQTYLQSEIQQFIETSWNLVDGQVLVQVNSP